VKIATWNVNSVNSRLEIVLDWCAREGPDVLCLQETKCIDERFPVRKFKSAGYPYIETYGEKGYNGVAIISNKALSHVEKNFPDGKSDEQKRLIAATIGDVRIFNVYVPHGTEMGSERYEHKLKWIRRLRKMFDDHCERDDKVLLCGDLNVAPHELDVWKPSVWRNKLHFTQRERDALLDLKRWGFVDLFRQMNDEVQEFSWWDYYYHSFEKDCGLRIDHIWTSQPLAERCVRCWIDKEPRKLEKTSDHAPVVATFDL